MKNILIVSLVFNLIVIATSYYLINRVGGLDFLIRKMFVAAKMHHYADFNQKHAYRPVVTDKIVFLGNSITEGGDWAEVFNTTSIVNRGIGGDMTSGVLSRSQKILSEKPAAIFLMIGINDLLQGMEQQIMPNYRAMFAEMKKQEHLKVYVQSILPVSDNYWVIRNRVKNEQIERVNKKIATLCSDYGFEFIDLYHHFTGDDGLLKETYTYDGLHLSAEGYEQWRRLIEHKVRQLLDGAMPMVAESPEKK